MEKENARKQTLEQLYERRKQVVRLHKTGIKIMKVVEMTGLSYPAVRAVIDLQVRSIGKYLTRWGFTPQKPEAVQAWLEWEYPGIEQRARSERAEIHWGDETALVNTDVRGRSYAPAGKTPTAMAVGGTSPQAVDDCHSDQSGQDPLDDY